MSSGTGSVADSSSALQGKLPGWGAMQGLLLVCLGAVHSFVFLVNKDKPLVQSGVFKLF